MRHSLLVARCSVLVGLATLGLLGPQPAAAALAAPVLKWQKGGCGAYCETGWYASPAVADLDGDGRKELIGPSDVHYISAFRDNGDQILANPRHHDNQGNRKFWSQTGVHVSDAVDLRGYAECGTEHRPNFADSAPIIADVNGDGVREVVVVGNVYNCGADPYTDLYHALFIFKATAAVGRAAASTGPRSPSRCPAARRAPRTTT